MSKDNIQRGSILISMPFLGDPNFERSVILICEHSEEGSFGLILNQKTTLRLSDFSMFEKFDDQVFLGGPVQNNTIHYIHDMKDLPGALEVVEELYWSGDFDVLKERIDMGMVANENIRFYLGYSGWGGGQLQDEVERDSWIVNNDYSKDIFKLDPNEIWRRILLDMGGEYAQFANYPIDPSLN